MNNKFTTKYIIFQCLKFLINFFKRHHHKISLIEKRNDPLDYFITFHYISNRQIFTKPVSKIYKNQYLLNSFSPEDAAIIGFYHTMLHLETLLKVRNNG